MEPEHDLRRRRVTTVRRDREQVTPLELFFDLIFVLAITQCTAMMAATPTWTGVLRGLLVLATLWWAWVGYAWLTSVVDPEEGAVRFAIFASMAALMVVTLSIPLAFDSSAATFAVAYGLVRAGQIVLFTLGSRDDPNLRASVITLAASTSIGITLIGVAAAFDGSAQVWVWAAAVAFDVLGPLFFGADGWKLVPGHFAERHGLIVIIALGESIVAIGVGASDRLDGGVIAAVVIGVAAVSAMWWSYFDVTVHVASRRLEDAVVGRPQNALARDAYSYAHFALVAGTVLFALGLKKTLAHVTDPLAAVPAAALAGGAALYYLGLIAFRARAAGSLSRPRLGLALVLAALAPVATHIAAIVSLTIITAAMWSVIAYEAVRFRTIRDEVRHSVGSHIDGSHH
jgi:low temperature requirement protein LtrA